MTLHVAWDDHGREPQCPPNPLLPDGLDVDVSEGAKKTCAVALPYPAPRCGVWVICCDECGLSVGVTAAGRPDDPRSVKVACTPLGPTGDFPKGKLNEEDEGGLTMAVSHQVYPSGGVVRIDFGKPTAWIGLPPDEAVAFAKMIVNHAMALKGGQT
jgi:hypothetical protein